MEIDVGDFLTVTIAAVFIFARLERDGSELRLPITLEVSVEVWIGARQCQRQRGIQGRSVFVW